MDFARVGTGAWAATLMLAMTLGAPARTVTAASDHAEPEPLPEESRREWVSAAGDSRWWSLEGDLGQAQEVDTYGSRADTELVLWQAAEDGGEWSEVARNDDFDGLASRLRFLPEARRRYRVEVIGRSAGVVRMRRQAPAPAFLPWAEVEPPANDLRENALALESTAPEAGVAVTLQAATPDIAVIPGPSVWYRWERPADWPPGSRLLVEVEGPGNPRMALFAPGSEEPLDIGVRRAGGGCRLALAPPEILELAVGAETTGRNQALVLRLSSIEPATNETWREPMRLEGELPLRRQLDITGARQDDEKDTIEANGGGVWFAYTPERDGRLEFATTDSQFDTQLAIYVRDGDGLRQLAFNDDDPRASGTTSRLELDAKAGEELLICAVGFNGEQGLLSLTVASRP